MPRDHGGEGHGGGGSTLPLDAGGDYIPRSTISISFQLHEESTNGLMTVLSRASNNGSSGGSLPRVVGKGGTSRTSRWPDGLGARYTLVIAERFM